MVNTYSIIHTPAQNRGWGVSFTPLQNPSVSLLDIISKLHILCVAVVPANDGVMMKLFNKCYYYQGNSSIIHKLLASLREPATAIRLCKHCVTDAV